MFIFSYKQQFIWFCFILTGHVELGVCGTEAEEKVISLYQQLCTHICGFVGSVPAKYFIHLVSIPASLHMCLFVGRLPAICGFVGHLSAVCGVVGCLPALCGFVGHLPAICGVVHCLPAVC